MENVERKSEERNRKAILYIFLIYFILHYIIYFGAAFIFANSGNVQFIMKTVAFSTHIITCNFFFKLLLFFALKCMNIYRIFLLNNFFLVLFIVSACVFTRKIKQCSRHCKGFIYIVIFLLSATTLSLNMTIALNLLPTFQTNLLTFITYNLLISSIAFYAIINILKHLQLIYWDIYKVSFEIHSNESNNQKMVQKLSIYSIILIDIFFSE